MTLGAETLGRETELSGLETGARLRLDAETLGRETDLFGLTPVRAGIPSSPRDLAGRRTSLDRNRKATSKS